MVRHISELYLYEGKKSAYNLPIRAVVCCDADATRYPNRAILPIWVTKQVNFLRQAQNWDFKRLC